MATYSSDKYTNVAPQAVHGQAQLSQWLYASVACAAAPSTADTINFGYLPANARILSAMLKGSDMDTGGPTLTINVGISGTPQLIFAASVAAGNGSVDRAMAVAGQFYKTSAKTLIVGVAQANATTPAAGTLELAIEYVVEDSPTSP